METEDAIRGRISAGSFDAERGIDEETLRELVALACRAPSTYNLQSWRFVLVRDAQARLSLADLAGGEQRLADAPAVFVVLGDLRASEDLARALTPSVERGDLDEAAAKAWTASASQLFSEPRRARDEAVRASSMAAMGLMVAATDRGLASFATAVFDVDRLREQFEIANRYVPTVLVALGHPSPGDSKRQKVRRGLGEVLVEETGRELAD